MKRRWKILIGVLAGLLVVLSLNALALNRQTKDAHKTVDDGQIVDTFAGEVQVTDSGSREKSPVVLLHCFTCSLHWWDAILPLLEQNHRVIRIELLGHGGSEKPTSGYSMDNQAAAVASALSTLGVERATVVGHSLGFAVATSLAERSPDLVARLVDIDEAPDSGYGDLPFTARLVGVPLLGQGLYRTAPDWQVRKDVKIAFAPHYNLASGFEDPDQPVADFNAMTYSSFTESTDEADKLTEEQPLDERLAELPTPIPLLVIFGAEDQEMDSPDDAAGAYRDVPGAIVSLIEGAGHSPNVEKPMETAALILEFAANPGDENLPPVSEFVPPNKQKQSKKNRP